MGLKAFPGPLVNLVQGGQALGIQRCSGFYHALPLCLGDDGGAVVGEVGDNLEKELQQAQFYSRVVVEIEGAVQPEQI